MLKPLLTQMLSHLMAQNAWAQPLLTPFGGKIVKVSLGSTSATLVILEHGGLAMAGDATTHTCHTVISIPIHAAIRMLAGDHQAHRLVQIEGDTALASAFARVLQHLKWDIEADLSQVIGDMPANQIVTLGKTIAHSGKQKVVNAAEMLSEYWQEEQPLIAKKRHVDQFLKAVDELNADTERLEKRLQKFESKHTSPTTN